MTDRMEILAPLGERYDEILTDEALEFVTRLHDIFAGRRQERLSGRMLFRQAIDNGRNLHFIEETRAIREDDSWRVAGAGPGLEDRRVEITAPTSRRFTVNALNSGADVWLADHEDSLSPTWGNLIAGQLNLSDAIRRTIDFTASDGREYRLAEKTATIVYRPRGLHLVEKHLRYTDQAGIAAPATASLVDFGLYFFHNARELVARGAGPYFYLPKLENYLEARLWDDVFTFSEKALELPHGTIRATVHIETISAAFEMEEILYELRDHAAGLNAGRWDYIFSIIKNFRGRGVRYNLPDRENITMDVPFMRAYSELLVKTAHKRGAHALGGMSATYPGTDDPERLKAALDVIAADKRREAEAGFDGSWVAHPALVELARAEFSRPNQLDVLREDVQVTARDLTDVQIDAPVTDAGVRQNVSIALRYLESWLRGIGSLAIDGLSADAAIAEISRAQLWQWQRQLVTTAEGTLVSDDLIAQLVAEEVAARSTPEGRYEEAAELFREITLGETFPTFLTIAAYSRHLVETAPSA